MSEADFITSSSGLVGIGEADPGSFEQQVLVSETKKINTRLVYLISMGIPVFALTMLHLWYSVPLIIPTKVAPSPYCEEFKVLTGVACIFFTGVAIEILVAFSSTKVFDLYTSDSSLDILEMMYTQWGFLLVYCITVLTKFSTCHDEIYLILSDVYPLSMMLMRFYENLVKYLIIKYL